MLVSGQTTPLLIGALPPRAIGGEEGVVGGLGDADFLNVAGLESRVDFRVCITLDVFSCFVFRF